MPSLMAPVCIVCNKKFDNMEYLGNHMKNIHSESDHSKIERLTETTKATLEQERFNFFEKNSQTKYLTAVSVDKSSQLKLNIEATSKNIIPWQLQEYHKKKFSLT